VGLRAVQNARVKSAFLREAKARQEKGDPAMALTYVNRYLQLDPANEEAMILKSRLLYDTAVTPAQMDEAALFLTRVLGAAGDQNAPERLEARKRLIELSLKLPDRFQAALEQADQLAAILRAKGGEGAVDAATRRLRAEALEVASETASDAERRNALLQDARAEFEKAEAMDPGDVPGAVRLASLYHDRLNKDDEARAVLDRVVASNEGRPGPLADALLARAQFTLETKGDAEKAEADIDRALSGDPKNVKARLAAARVALQRNDPATARKHLQAAPAENARLPELKLVEGLIDLTERRPDAAIEAWRAGLVAGGGVDAELTWRLAQLLMEVGRVPEARVLVDQFRRLAGGEANPRYQYLAGLEHLKSNRPRDAIAALESVRFKLDGALESQLQFALGQAYEGLRDIPKAMEAYRRSADTSREWSGPWLSLAALEMAGDPDAARLTLRRGLALNPTDPKLLGALARVLTSDQMKKPPADRRWGEVDQILADADRAAPGDPDVALVKAEYLATTGKIDDAF
ncbi:MAG: tetratricopeptide repeat protein, partial [Thermoleophilia bacterium]|nr:tetratricopeptide repeat protein [Thermoleophilia bacterium]